MSLDRIRSRAEKDAIRIIDELRERVLGKVASASKLNGFEGRNLRSETRRTIQTELESAKRKLAPYLLEAWDEGVSRASKEVSKSLAISNSSLFSDLDSFAESIESSFKSLAASIEDDVTTQLQRGGLKGKEVSELLDKLKADSFYKNYKARSAGIITEELVQVEAYAHSERAREIARSIELVERALGPASTRTKKKDTDKEILVMHVWRHSGGGNPPRQNHIDMHNRAVVKGHKFKLKGRDGKTYECDGPKDTKLPDGEVINCHCRFVQKVLFVTPDERTQIEELSLSTGGYEDNRWSL